MIDFTIGKERPISWELPEQISLESDWFKFCADLKRVFNETRLSYSIYSRQASYRKMKLYLTSKLIEHNKNK